jgi:hypothetical protein
MLGDGDKIVVHNITKNLKMHTLVTNHRIIINYEEISMIEFYSCYKITNEKHIFFEQLIKALIVSNDGSKQDKVNNM